MPLKQIALAADQLANTLLGGMADETLSARCWRCRERNRFWAALRAAVDLLFWFDPHHCLTSYEAEKRHRHMPKEYRNDTE